MTESLRKFVLSRIYGEKATTCSEAKPQSGENEEKSLGRLPPDQDILDHHLERVNHLTHCQKHSNLRQHPYPIVMAG